MRSKKLGGDLAEFGKKRNTHFDFPLPYMWTENNKNSIGIHTTPRYQKLLVTERGYRDSILQNKFTPTK